MEDMDFLDRQTDMINDLIIDDIKNDLFQNWIDSAYEEGAEYAEHKIMEYASEDLQQAYNVHYGLTMDDDNYFVPANGWDEYLEYHARNI
jgi:hypothetical protein